GVVQGANRRHRRARHGRRGRDDGRPRAGRRGATQVRRRLGRRAGPQRHRLPRHAALTEVAPMAPHAPHLVLVGMMGAGKTTVGRRVAKLLGRPLLDSDQMIESRTGRTVREIFEADGEQAFRVLETAALVDALAEPEPLVIAAAGGVLLREENREALQRSFAKVIWLRADPAVLADRATRGQHRPLLDGDPLAAMERLLPEREPLYRAAADLVVDTDRLDPDT